MQLVFPLRAHALLALTLIALSRRPHRHRARSRGLNRRKGKQSLELRASALWAEDAFPSSHEGLEVVPAALAGVFVDRYDGTLTWSDLVDLDERYAEDRTRGNGTISGGKTMNALKRVSQIGATLATLALAGGTLPGAAQAQETELDREQVTQFARAHIAMNFARDEFHGKVGRIHDEDGRRRARVEMDSQVEGILLEHRMTRERYDEITLVISLDGEIRSMFDEILTELEEEGTAGR